MKTQITIIITFLISIASFAQTGFNYKALIKDELGNVVASETVSIRFTILDALSDGNIEYQGTHYNVMTDANGIAIVNIGEGYQSLNYSFFSELDWGNNAYYLRVEIGNAAGLNYVDMGTTQFMAVPYAKHAETAGTADSVILKIDDLTDAKSDSDGSQNGSSVFLGIDSGYTDDGTNNRNVGVGFEALKANTYGYNNVANGHSALKSNTVGHDNIAIGANALTTNGGGNENTAIGSNALAANYGSRNTATGFETLRFNTSSFNNSAHGNSALRSNTVGNNNTANGNTALRNNIGGDANVAIGSAALITNTEGNENTAIGTSILYENITGNKNTAIGMFALFENTSGSNNIAIGMSAGSQNSTGFNNVFIGNNSGDSSQGSNKLFINDEASSEPLIYGEFDTDLIRVNGTFEVNNGANRFKVLENGKTGINTLDPQSLLEIAHRNVAPTSIDLTNAFGIRNIVDSNEPNDDESWQFYVTATGSLQLFRKGAYRGYFHHTSGAYVQTSDRRVKKDIISLENGTLNKVMQLNPVSYLMKDQTDTKRNLGLISQEVQELFPSITHYVKESDLLTLSYTELIPILIKALQEQQTIIEAQNAKDVIQDKSIEALVTRLNLIEAKSSN